MMKRGRKLKMYEYMGEQWTLEELVKESGEKKHNIRRWINEYGVDEAMKLADQGGLKPGVKGKKYELNGECKEVSEFAIQYGVTEPTIRNWIALQKAGYSVGKVKKGNLLWEGEYYTVTELAKIAGISLSAMSRRLSRAEGNVESAMRVGPKKYEYRGNIYSAKELADLAGIRPETMWLRLKSNSVEDAVEHKRGALYEYRGTNYNLSELAEVTGITRVTLYKRIKESGLTVEEAVELPFHWDKRKEYREQDESSI